MNEKNSFEIGHGKLREFYEMAIKQLPDNPKVGLSQKRKGQKIYLDFQFYIGDKQVQQATKEPLTYTGIQKAIEKAKLISQYLSNCQSENDFWLWYNEAIVGKGQIKNDLMTFGEAIALVDAYYWDGYDRNKNKRVKDKNNPIFPNWERTWQNVYGGYFSLVPIDAVINYELIEKAINTKQKATKAYKDCVNAFKKLAELSCHNKIWDQLSKLDTRVKKRSQNDDKPLQTISIDDFLDLHKAIWEYGVNNKACHRFLESRKSWLWVFSIQAVYGFRISEVFGVQNIDKPYKTKDGVIIPALNDPENTDMMAVVYNTVIGTSNKTGYRLARPLIPPKHPDLIEKLGIKEGKLPDNRPKKDSKPSTKASFFKDCAIKTIVRWQEQIKNLLGDKDPLTQTHALRHLANLNGIMAGISLEQRAMSLGHSPTMNDSTYKKRKATKTTLEILTTQVQLIPLEVAIGAYKTIYGNEIDDKGVKLIATIYSVEPEKVKTLINQGF